MGLPEKKFGAEYAGEQFHGPEHQEHDAWRRSWLRREEGWTIVVARKHNVYGQQQGIDGLLLAGAAQAGITLK